MKRSRFTEQQIVVSFPRNFVFQAEADRMTKMEGVDVQDTEAGIHMQAKIGQQALEIDFLAVALGRFDDASGKK